MTKPADRQITKDQTSRRSHTGPLTGHSHGIRVPGWTAALGLGLFLVAVVIGVLVKTHPDFLRAEYVVNHALRDALQPTSLFGGLSVGINYLLSPIGTIVIIALIAWLIGARRHELPAALRFIIYSGLGALTSIALKSLFHEPRPQANGLSLGPWLVSEPGHNSFPSGHAAAVTTLVVTLCLLLGSQRARRTALPLGIVAILIVTASRVYLGVHYLTDVIGGTLAAAGTVLVVAWLWDTYLVKVVPLSKGNS